MEGLGTMTWEDFITDAKAMVKMSTDINDGWELIGEEGPPGTGYLSRQVKTFVPCNYPIEDKEDSTEYLESSMDKDPFEADSNLERPLITLHHILWSMSYGVPVLYFNGWKSDFPGCNPISVEVAQKLLKNEVLGYSELSQAIHPILATPFLQLHPCKSQELLSQVWTSKNKIVSWLSAAAPAALGLKIRDDYYKLTV